MRRGVYVNLDNTNYNLDLHIFIAVQVKNKWIIKL